MPALAIFERTPVVGPRMDFIPTPECRWFETSEPTDALTFYKCLETIFVTNRAVQLYLTLLLTDQISFTLWGHFFVMSNKCSVSANQSIL